MSKKKEDHPKEFVIPVSGTLGLLALGAKGVMAWRKVRDAAKKTADKKEKDE